MENSEVAPATTEAPTTPTAPETQPTPEPTPEASEAAPKPKGRPQGSKDRQPRTRRPAIRVEPVPPRESPAAPPRERTLERQPTPAPARSPTPEPVPEEPPSPQTLYRETSERLVHLRGLLNESRRSVVADKYTSRLSSWAV